MKAKIGDPILLFNAENGEFLAKVTEINKKNVRLSLLQQTRVPTCVPDVWLLFAPLKKDQTDYVIQKATELGCAKIIPVITQFCITDKTKTDRFRAQAIEAAEQSRRIDVPLIDEAVPLMKILSSWDKNRPLFFMDETGKGLPVRDAFLKAKEKRFSSAALLVGPEGGFSLEELSFLRSLPFAYSVSLGPRILRAETAAVAALACWQALLGDWSNS